MRLPRGPIVALSFLTRVPTPDIGPPEADDLRRAAPFFPAVGLLIGCLLASALWLLGDSDPWIGALAALVLWIWITGALHLDGLGDVADAFGAGHKSPERLIQVLDDPHAGNFAVVAISLLLATKLVLLSALPVVDARLAASLALVPAWARWSALALAGTIAPLKPGLGAALAEALDWRITVLWGAALAILSLWFEPMLLAALVIVPLAGWLWKRRLGGISGDSLGATVEWVEALLLASIAVLGSAG